MFAIGDEMRRKGRTTGRRKEWGRILTMIRINLVGVAMGTRTRMSAFSIERRTTQRAPKERQVHT